ncbi:hypothetical protein KFK14_05440 [Sphingobium phenoxybenzoativorans]|uniref:Uncharacterized protein n=1 Tax=Sphingobium phenoxybenzoativorans TaxID=1592790 RepID=A0A975Q2W2_9SPHN|nr:hypothetical protein [Sphingobium phenoxybenzoativorans]QUT06882.1 hypothetical protein KFK14_05440 [Sphingobium phenoxybenzoativorans]
MVHGKPTDLRRFASAARQIMEEGIVDADAGKFSRTVKRAVLLPRGAIANGHFAIGEAGLERREGRPAPSLGAGMIRAADTLVKLAKRDKGDEPGFGVGIVELPLVI